LAETDKRDLKASGVLNDLATFPKFSIESDRIAGSEIELKV
jgi:hypothetical protein